MVANVTGVVYYAIAARLLPSVADFGRIATFQMICLLFITLSSFVLPSAIVKLMAEYNGGGRHDDTRGLYGLALRLGGVFALASFTICFLAADPIASYLLGGPEYTDLVRLLSIDVLLLVLVPYMTGLLQGQQRFGTMALLGSSNAILRHAIAVLALYVGLGLQGVIIGWVVGDLSQAVLSFLLVFRGSGTRMEIGMVSHPIRPMIKYSTPLYVSAVITFFIHQTDKFLILFLAGQEALGLYSPAVTAMSVLLLFSNAFTNVLFPQLSERCGRLGIQSLKEISRTFSKYVYLVYTPLAFGIAAVARPIMIVFVGERFIGGALPLAILSLSSALACGSVITNSVLLATGKTGIFSLVGILSVVADIVFAFLLIGPLGPVGAAIARSSVVLVQFIVPTVVLTKTLGQHLDLKSCAKSIVASSVSALAVLGVQAMSPSTSLLPLLAAVVVGGLVYLVMLRVLKALGRGDFMLLGSLLPKRTKKLVKVAETILIGNQAQQDTENEEDTDIRQQAETSEPSPPPHATV